MGLKVAAPRYFSMNLKTEKSRLDLFYEAARIYLLKGNASHTNIQLSNDKTIIGLDLAKYRDLSLFCNFPQPLASTNNESARH